MAERFTQITCSDKGEIDSTEFREKELKWISQEEKKQEEAGILWVTEPRLTPKPTSLPKIKFTSRPIPRITPKPERGRDLCRIKLFRGGDYGEVLQSEDYGGYRKDILTENLTERDKVILICKKCKGIMKEACISTNGDQFCSSCENSISKGPHTAIRETINSLKCSCPLIERGCKWFGTLEGCEDHLDKCGYVNEKCKLNCGTVLRREELERHEKENCTQRVVKCDHCDKNFKSCQLNGHLEKCPKMKVSCSLCGTKIRRDKMGRHLEYDCGMVQDTCKLGCGVELTRNKLEIHEKENCIQRKIRCKYCSIDVTFCDNSKHLKECPLVTVTCDLCSVEKYRKDMTQHLIDDCPEKMIDCPFVKYKCLARIKRKYIDKHLEEKETKHLELKLTAMEDLITKQSEEFNKQSEIINKQSKEIIKLNENIKIQNQKTTREISNTSSRQIELLYSITDTTKIVWKIEDVKYCISYSSVSKQYEVAGYRLGFKFHHCGSLSIVFPGTTTKPDRTFIAKCHIVLHNLHSCHTINCGIIEVKQKDVTRGYEIIITIISKGDIEKYSEPQFPGVSTKKDLTFEIFITMQ